MKHRLRVTVTVEVDADNALSLRKALDESGCDGDLCMHEWHDAARAAIAKAEGKP